ncbi:MAG: DNA primase [Planctomycetota bacterium]|jgi:DNA primase|nr:DNA primase [Planctomycetota bacterium]
MALYSQDFVERVRAANELSQVVASYNVHLKRAGSNMLGLCPFHNEKTPSFNIRPADQFFRCFGCGAKGDVFRFVQMMEKVEFPEAVKILAERAGLPLEYDSPAAAREAGRNSRLKTSLLWCCSRALDYFEECLAGPGGAAAREYLASRGFEKETVSRWRIGWAPDSWDGLSGFLLKSAKEPGQKEQVLEYAREAGLLRAKEDERGGKRRLYDAFRGRVMFPITDSQSRPIAFGGRVLEEKPGAGGKYINSPEGRLFEKRSVLFGLAQASKEIALTGEAVVVEGYVDVIMCHQHGIRNVVATLGTSLTEEHVGLLRRHVQGKGRTVAFFDADAAGEKATRRALDLFMAQDVPLAVAGGLDVKDAADFLPRYGADDFRKRIAQARDGFSYLLENTLGRVRGRDPQAMGLAVREALETVNLCPDAIKRSLMRQRLAAEAGIPEEALPQPVQKAPKAPAAMAARVAGKARPPVKKGLMPSTAALDMEEALARGVSAVRRREARLFRYMWDHPEWCARIADRYPPDEWRDEALAGLAALVRDEWAAGKQPVLHDIRARVANPDAADRLADLAFPDDEPMSEKDLSLLLSHLQGENRKEELAVLQRELERAEREGDSDRAAAILAKKNALRMAAVRNRRKS